MSKQVFHFQLNKLSLRGNKKSIMIYTINIDETTVKGRLFAKELLTKNDVAKIENPAQTGYIPEGYMTVERFRERSTVMIKKMFENYE
jgi:hypothetical protein